MSGQESALSGGDALLKSFERPPPLPSPGVPGEGGIGWSSAERDGEGMVKRFLEGPGSVLEGGWR